MNSSERFRIRVAGSGDSDAIAVLLDELGYPADASSVAQRLRQLQKDRGATVLVGEHDGRVVALASYHVFATIHLDEPAAWITALVVAESARRTGVGRSLVCAIERSAASAGCTHVAVTSGNRRTDAHQFYERLGYRRTGARFAKPLP